MKATVTGSGELRGLVIDPKAVDPEDTETLADLVVAAVQAANENAQQLQQQKLGPLAQGLGGMPRPALLSLRAASTQPTVPSRRDTGTVTKHEGRQFRCTKAWSRTSSTNWAGCPASVPRARSGSPSTSCRPSPTDVRRLAHALLEVKDKVRFCAVCGNVAQEEQCGICRDPRRDPTVICVVEEPKDVVAIERTREFRGRYHVLGGAISPIEGVGPDDLRIRELLARLADGDGHRADPGHRPQSGGRGHRHVPRAHDQAHGPEGHPPGQRAARGGRPGVRGRGHARACLRGETTSRCLTPTLHAVGPGPGRLRRPDRRPDRELHRRGHRGGQGRRARTARCPSCCWRSPSCCWRAAGWARTRTSCPDERYEPDRARSRTWTSCASGFAVLLEPVDVYSEVFDPYEPRKAPVACRISDDLADVVTDLRHGLAHYRAGRITEALWWWQFSYFSNWGPTASATLRALQSLVAHVRLDQPLDGAGRPGHGRGPGRGRPGRGGRQVMAEEIAGPLGLRTAEERSAGALAARRVTGTSERPAGRVGPSGRDCLIISW